MLVSVAGFGSLWRRRFDKHQADSHQFARGVYYNTAGVEITGTIRQRPKITGYARFHACGGPRFYKCWAGCTKKMIRAALGHPIRVRTKEIGEPIRRKGSSSQTG